MKDHTGTYREALRQYLVARPPRLPSHLKKRQVALCEVRFMMCEKHQYTPSSRDRVLTRPEQRAMLKKVGLSIPNKHNFKNLPASD